MGAEDNKAVVRRWIELWNTHDVAAVDEMVSSDYVRHDPNAPEVRGPEAQKQLLTMFFTAFPDLHLTIEDLIAEGDKVVARLTARGTHQGELLGMPPSNTRVAIMLVDIFRLADGRIAEQWAILDILGMLQQIGAIPTPGAPAQ
jgi:steroid delta-isomerase-like uncharacterized protein